MVEEADLVTAFMDAAPVAPGHVLVVPRRHVASVGELTVPEGAALWALAQRMCARVRDRCAPAVNLHLAEGAEAEQDVPHVHLHVIPRHAGDHVRIHLPGTRADAADLQATAAVLRRMA